MVDIPGTELDDNLPGTNGRRDVFDPGGNDTLTGGRGADTFVISGETNATITDFSLAQGDHLQAFFVTRDEANSTLFISDGDTSLTIHADASELLAELTLQVISP